MERGRFIEERMHLGVVAAPVANRFDSAARYTLPSERTSSLPRRSTSSSLLGAIVYTNHKFCLLFADDYRRVPEGAGFFPKR